jgi:hypothetical protein
MGPLRAQTAIDAIAAAPMPLSQLHPKTLATSTPPFTIAISFMFSSFIFFFLLPYRFRFFLYFIRCFMPNTFLCGKIYQMAVNVCKKSDLFL